MPVGLFLSLSVISLPPIVRPASWTPVQIFSLGCVEPVLRLLSLPLSLLLSPNNFLTVSHTHSLSLPLTITITYNNLSPLCIFFLSASNSVLLSVIFLSSPP